MILKKNKYEDFVVLVLKVLYELGGQAWLSEIEEEFFRQYAEYLDPDEDWQEKTPNHNKELWRDHCGSRLAWHHLKPNKYIIIESHGSKGSIWKLTEHGRSIL